MKQKTTLKAMLTMLVCLAFFSIKSSATIHTVNVADFQFSPATISDVVVGDVIKWIWVSGTHTTTCDPDIESTNSLPAGAATWDASITSGSTTFQYTVTVAGVYNYFCNIHGTIMSGSFTA